MSTSTRTLVPGPRVGAGTRASAEAVSERTWEEIVARAGRADYERWAEQIERTGGCSHPVRLKGRVVEQTPLGTVLRYTTAVEPDGELLIRCGNHRASVCPSCAFTYAGDSWHLFYAGAAGGHKGVSARVAEHPKVFASVTAPSFGPVHSDPVDKNGRPARCRPRSGARLCEHGWPTWCMRRHTPDDPALGEPLCPGCYDYEAAAAFNWVAPELWRRFTIALARALAKSCDLTNSAYARLLSAQYAKVAEFQRRALIHFHGIIRLDGKPAKGDVDQWPAPPLHVTASDRPPRAARGGQEHPHWYDHARAYVEMKWPHAAAKSRRSMADALATVTPALVGRAQGASKPEVLRKALYGWAFNSPVRSTPMPPEIAAALRRLEKASLPIAELADSAVIRQGLDACTGRRRGRRLPRRPPGGSVPSSTTRWGSPSRSSCWSPIPSTKCSGRRPRCPRRSIAGCRQPRPGAWNARRRAFAGRQRAQARRLLRTPVLRGDAPVRGGRPRGVELPAAEHRLGPADPDLVGARCREPVDGRRPDQGAPWA